MVNLNFRGKSEVYSYHLAVPHHDLSNVDKSKSVGKADGEGNLIIQGDNLLALKSLLPKYEGRVKCIYIDPPYNTGKENWVYNDNVGAEWMEKWLGSVVDLHDSSRHDKWLCMMWPRLQLLRRLLADDGVIFISIDDNEQHRLRAIMDEIFGENNFVGCVTREQKKGANRGTHFAPAIDYIVAYSKNIDNLHKFSLPISEEYIKSFKLNDNDGKSNFKLTNLYEPSLDYYENCRYPIKCPDGVTITTPKGKSFTHNKESFERLLEEDSIRIVKARSSLLETIDGQPTKWSVKRKLYLKEMIEKGKRPTNLLRDIINAQGKSALTALNINFEFSKPPALIHFLLSIIGDTSAIVLDSFAGSGTTAHAVLALNKEDGGNRKFILVECEDYADNITAERVRRVIKGVPSAKDKNLKKGLGGEFSYIKLGDAIDFKKILLGKALPSYNALATLLFSQITGQSLPKIESDKKTWFVGENESYRVHLIYENKKGFLQSDDSYLTLKLLERMKKKLKGNQKSVIFAAGRHVDFNHLRNNNALFIYLPHEINKHFGQAK